MEKESQSRLWYFAYGSNLSLDKLIGGRGIHPVCSARVRVPGWRLTLEIAGLPYQEPAFTSISPIEDRSLAKEREVVGVAYLITPAEWTSLVASEGGGTVYSNLTLSAEPMTEKDSIVTGPSIEVCTLGTAFGRSPAARPSERYMNIIVEGAVHHQLPPTYLKYLRDIEVYHPPERRRTKIGATLFIAIWGPIMGVAEKVTNATTSRRTGRVPPAIVFFVRLVLIFMWSMHDHFFAPIWGRGDGLDGETSIAFSNYC